MWYVKKFFKFILIMLLVLLIVLVLSVAGVYIYHRVMLPKNKDFLKENGYYNPVSAGDHSLNMITSGSDSAKHRLIVLSGAGPAIYFDMKEMTEILDKDDNQLIFLSRAGYDESDDTEADMSVENVVEDYRKALENAGVQKPYLLMPHSLGGVYASYWVSKYPEEIEGMVDIDGTCPRPVENAVKSEEKKSLIYYLANVGVGDVRPVLHYYFPYSANQALSKEEQRASDIMYISTFSAKAFEEEGDLWDVNLNSAWEAMKTTDVPKVYITATLGLRTKDEVREYMEENRPEVEMTEVDCHKALDEITKEREETLMPCIEKLGNCEMVYLPGNHFIFKQKPEECAQIVKDFITKLDEKEAQELEEARQKEEEEKKAAEAAKKKKKSKKKKSA